MTLTTKAQRAEERKKAAHNPAASKPAASKNVEAGEDAIALLTADHAEVAHWFDEYEDATDDNDKAALSAKICLALTVHAQIEEELFYPQSREATKDEDMIDEAMVEHAGAKHLIAKIQSVNVGDKLYDAKVRVLCE